MEECLERRLFRHGQDHVCQRPLLFLPGRRYELSSLQVITEIFRQLPKTGDRGPLRRGWTGILRLLVTTYPFYPE